MRSDETAEASVALMLLCQQDGYTAPFELIDFSIPEVTCAAVEVLEAVARRYGHHFTFTDHLIGGCSIDRFGTALSDLGELCGKYH